MVVAYTVYLTCFGKIEQTEAVEVEPQFDPLVGRQTVVVVLDYHVAELVDYLRLRTGFLGRDIDAYHYRRGENRAHHIDRKIVIYTSVI